MEHCKQCGRALTEDETALYRKLINRGATEFECIDCLAAFFRVSRGLLEQKIVQFKAMGCTLFPENRKH